MSRQNDMRLLMAERENEYISKEEVRVFCGTFNANGKSPDEDLRSWLFLHEREADVYAIGFQEVVDLSTTSYLLQSDWLEREQRWINAVDVELCNNERNSFSNLKSFLSKNKKPVKYRRIVKYRMFGILLLIYVNEKIDHTCISEIFCAEVPTGIMETLGNKGSVGISFKLHETRMCFVCSHFASDTRQLQKRNADFRSSRQRLKFVYNANADYYDLECHDAVFWFGDFNYRLDKISLNRTIELIYSNENEKLLEHDQLSIEMKLNNVFEDYKEGKINFRPTYKYVVKEDIYEKQIAQRTAIQNNDLQQLSDNESSTAKMKLPSWTDRILWKASNIKINLVQYSCINTITISDHKPVYALFDVEVKKIDEKKFNKIYDALLKDSDRRLNEEMPRISIEKFDYKFADCSFYDQKAIQINVKNDGLTRSNVDVQFYDPSTTLPDKNNETDFSIDTMNQRYQHKMSQWCTIYPQHKERVEPGTSYKINVSTNLNYSNLIRLNKNQSVDDFLIVRCLNGNDVFVTISCEYRPSVIGFSLKTLSTLPKDKSFDSFEKKNELIDEHETHLENFERNLDAIWLHSLKFLSTELEKKNAEKLFGSLESNNVKSSKTSKFYSESTPALTFETASDSKAELFKTLMLNLKQEIVDKDKYFKNDLSDEWSFFIQHLIDQCSANLENLESNNDSQNGSNRNSIKIEDQKNLVLSLLSSREFEKFRAENFDLELLAEVLYDLLYALPNPLIPQRYVDLFMFISDDYKEALAIFEAYFSRSHFQLFELLIKFLQIYLKCLVTCDSNLNSLIANAIFKINPVNNNFATGNVDKDYYKSQTANKLLKLFIENHKNFKTI